MVGRRPSAVGQKKLSTTVEVFQKLAPSKEMLEAVDALAARLDEFKDRGCGQCSYGEGK
jgi:hypothetical protein